MDRLLEAIVVLSLLLIVSVLVSVRRQHIRVEYSVSWLGAAVVALWLALSPGALASLAAFLDIPHPPLALLLVIGLLFILVFYRFSVIISELKDANISLTQRVAILEYRLNAAHEETQARQAR
jgi:hypothetical protein